MDKTKTFWLSWSLAMSVTIFISWVLLDYTKPEHPWLIVFLLLIVGVIEATIISDAMDPNRFRVTANEFKKGDD